ncbi:MAG: hypothetical protein J07HQW2_00797 [Haloquadratum walsbyi J07HQW2]|uniref:Uncharacterized protein n=1 Tax=Haloquadratum walsbyi J07HQW2 TaxID=1238425 RepID=U1NCH5_9EURY|nr:MAG: hypothetical protein J07HQW2_00595 [Haloquadratum walsbyi J07HQW2]ERG94363.1 MAG: hypothetical protein J07HQW2_00797 [Haloquadratum walsbyi J07HQW2]
MFESSHHDKTSIKETARVPRPTVGGGEARHNDEFNKLHI